MAASSPDGDPIATLVAAIGTICARVSACYPQLQDGNVSQCSAPSAVRSTITFVDPSNVDTARIERCLRAYPDQDEIVAFAECQLREIKATLACLSSCPLAADECERSGSCPHIKNQEAFGACNSSE
jgi:hypothetical protein